MKMAEASKVNQPFFECLDNRLDGFRDQLYVKEVCEKMFGQDVRLLLHKIALSILRKKRKFLS